MSPSKDPPTPSNVWVGFGLCQQPPGSLPGWDRPGSCHPRQGNLTLTLEGTGSSSGSRHQGGAGGKRPVPWKATVPNFEKREDPGLQQRSAPPSVTSHSPLGEKSPGLGATRTHPCFNRLWAEQGVRLNFLPSLLLKRLNLWESPGSPVVNRTRSSHSGRAFDPWSGN